MAPGFSPVLAADPQLQIGPSLPPQRNRHGDQPAHSGHVQLDKRIGLDDVAFQVGRQEDPRIIAGKPPGGLGQVVGTEGKELGLTGNLVGGERRPGKFNHRAEEIGHCELPLSEDLFGDLPHDQRLLPELDHVGHEWGPAGSSPRAGPVPG